MSFFLLKSFECEIHHKLNPQMCCRKTLFRLGNSWGILFYRLLARTSLRNVRWRRGISPSLRPSQSCPQDVGAMDKCTNTVIKSYDWHLFIASKGLGRCACFAETWKLSPKASWPILVRPMQVYLTWPNASLPYWASWANWYWRACIGRKILGPCTQRIMNAQIKSHIYNN